MKQELEPSKNPALLHLLNGAREAAEIAKSFDSQLHYIIIAATDNGNSLDSINGERPILVKILGYILSSRCWAGIACDSPYIFCPCGSFYM